MDIAELTPRERLIWAAGLFDGEGCANVYERGGRGKKGRCVQVRLGMTDRDVVENFAVAMGCGSISTRIFDQKMGKEHWKPFHTWVVYEAAEVIRVLEMLKPYLGERRFERFDEVLEVARTIQPHNREKTHCTTEYELPDGTRKVCGLPLSGSNLIEESTGRIKKDGSVQMARRCRACRRRRENARRAPKLKGPQPPKTHCPEGHPYEGENLVIKTCRHRDGSPREVKVCRICRNKDAAERFRRRTKAKHEGQS